MMDDQEFANQVECLLRGSIKTEPDEYGDLTWDSFHGPLLALVEATVCAGGQQDPAVPGQIRIDMGTPQSHGGLTANGDTLLVIDFNWMGGDQGCRFLAKYNLAEELIRYAEIGEQGRDIARQIDQLQRTISVLSDTAAARGWELPAVR